MHGQQKLAAMRSAMRSLRECLERLERDNQPEHPSSAAVIRAASKSVMQDVLEEIASATGKFAHWPTDPLHALAVLGEEFGELTREILQMTYEPHKTNRERIRREAIQTAAMALRLAESLDVYEYTPCKQHRQAITRQ
jgi:NTP pyrophosphatase (non-canonical NTP hydrolase)